MEMSSSQEWMGNNWAPQNRKHGCKSKIDIDIDIEPSGENGIVSENNRFIKIDPGGPPWEEKLPLCWRLTKTVRKDTKLEYILESNWPPQPSWIQTINGNYKFGWWSEG